MAPNADTPSRTMIIQVADDENVGPVLLIQRARHAVPDRHFVRREFTLYYDEIEPYYIKTEKGRW